ncbi:MAG: CapA family protein [Pseudobutyrivibrio sp.]|nr:CapA family protein [Pseudobutyrivibrio sp.]
MRKRSLFTALLAASALLLTGCGKKIVEVEPTYKVAKQPQIIEIADLNDAWDTILNNSTREFIGGHPIDEAFLSMVTATYGESVIEEIASYANFTTPEIWFQCTGKSIHVLWYDYCQKTGLESYSFDKTYVINKEPGEDIVMDFTGDLCLTDGVATTAYMDDQMNGINDCFSEDLLEEMRSADLLMINNEFAFTSRGAALFGKAYTFRANPFRVAYLKEIGVDLVSVANNHVFDYDETGFLDTLQTLENAGIPYVGAGRNIEEAKKPVYYIVGGKKIAIVAATQIERTLNYTKEATETTPGVLKCLYPEVFCKTIKMAKNNADYVIVFPHWGTEGNANYGPDQVALARAFVEAGADVIIGGHTHCLQTVEFMDDVPIYYSLGNYWFSTTANMPAEYKTAVAQVRINPEGRIDTYLIPCKFNAGVTSRLYSEDKTYSDIINSLNNLSHSAVIDDVGHITKK